MSVDEPGKSSQPRGLPPADRAEDTGEAAKVSGKAKGWGERATEPSREFVVEPSGVKRPYMRGIMVHSLMARGASFDEAYATADRVGERIRGRGTVERAELAKMVSEELGDEYEHQPPIPVPITFHVVDGARRTPFSKGVLSQSLLAASLEPSDAFDVARSIEFELHRRGDREISHSELRRLAYEALLERFGHRAAQRYRVWREYQEPDQPVIILLGGTTGAGKTSLALEVARRLGISRVLSTDAIRQVMRIMLSPELMPALHRSSFEAHEEIALPRGIQDPVIEGFMSQAEIVTVGVRALIDRAVEENVSLVLDGVALVPGLIDLEEYQGRAHIFNLLVARLDVDSFGEQFRARAESQKQRVADRYVERLDEILKIQEFLLDLAEEHGVPIVDNITLEGSVLLVIRHVVETLRTQSEMEFPQSTPDAD